MPTVTVSGIPINYMLTGGGQPTLCLIHGAGGNAGVWIRQLEGLADTARVIAIDLPGHGQSGGEACQEIDRYAAIVRGFIEGMKLSKVVLGGHSMGGGVAQAIALAHPDLLGGLVLVGTGARLRVLPQIFDSLEQDYAEGVRFVMSLAFGPGAPPTLMDSLARQTLETPRSVIIGDFRASDSFDAMGRVGELRLPTLIINGGEEDRLTPPKYAHFFRDRIPGARLALFPGAGHYVQLERAEETTAAIRDFLASLP
ncbi:MAG: alpha/beta fold hydrolase [Candidatus Methylomirabilia bacterium]